MASNNSSYLCVRLPTATSFSLNRRSHSSLFFIFRKNPNSTFPTCSNASTDSSSSSSSRPSRSEIERRWIEADQPLASQGFFPLSLSRHFNSSMVRWKFPPNNRFRFRLVLVTWVREMFSFPQLTSYSIAALSDVSERFTVASYNILADRNASKHADMYLNVPSSYVKWDYRKRVICKELFEWDPDIICLQVRNRHLFRIWCFWRDLKIFWLAWVEAQREAYSRLEWCFQEVDKYVELSNILVKAGYTGSYKVYFQPLIYCLWEPLIY